MTTCILLHVFEQLIKWGFFTTNIYRHESYEANLFFIDMLYSTDKKGEIL